MIHRDRYIIEAPNGDAAIEKSLRMREATIGTNGLESTYVSPHYRPDLWAVTLVYDKAKRMEWN